MMEKLVPNNDSETMMAIVMLGDVDLPGNNALSSAIRVRLPDVSLPGEDAKSFLLFEQGAMCVIMRLDVPCPISQQDSCFSQAWYWPKAWESVKQLRSHMIVSVSGGPIRGQEQSSSDS